VGWNDNQPEGFLWSDSVWVFVDYNKNGVMTRLPVTDATVSAGVVEKIFGNDKGVWVIGNARAEGSFSATVQLLTDITDVAGACAYASNYPPVGEYKTYKQLVFTGTPMYNLVLRHLDNKTDTIYRVSDGNYDLPEDYVLVSFTDATGAPGRYTESSAAPPLAASATKWYYAGQTWSDVIITDPSNCTKVNVLIESSPARAYGMVANDVYYTKACLDYNASALCPPPWRAPSIADFRYLIRVTTYVKLISDWLRGRGVLSYDANTLHLTGNRYIWAIDAPIGSGYYLLDGSGSWGVISHAMPYLGYPLRCVK
jgi:hypothetical protein